MSRSGVPASLARCALVLTAVAVGTVAPGCFKRAPGTNAVSHSEASAAPMDADAAGREHSDESAMGDDGAPADLDVLRAQLVELEDSLADAGVAVVGRRPHGATPAAEEAGRCTRVCDLKDAICDLEGNICSLAADHAGEAHYADACARVQTDCGWAQEACDACSDA